MLPPGPAADPWAETRCRSSTGQSSLRRQHQDCGRVRELFGLRVVFVLKSGGLRDRVNRARLADQEMPSPLGAGAVVAPQKLLFLLRRQLGSVFGIEANGDDFEFLAYIELQHAQSAFQAGELFAAQHRAAVVDEVEDQRLLAEVIAQLHLAAQIVGKYEVRWNLLVQVLLNADILQSRRTHVGWRRHNAAAHALAPGGSCEER